jgi:hypothetical protein
LTAAERKERAEILATMIRELSRERNPSTRLFRLYTMVFRTREFQEWFREERSALNHMLDREEQAEQARAVRRGLPTTIAGTVRGRRRKPTLH